MSGAPPPGLPPPPTVSGYCAVCTALPVPVAVSARVPGGAEAVGETVMVAEEPACTEEGLKPTVTPLGAPEALRPTVCALPEVTAVATAAVVEPPGWTLPEAGPTESEKSLVPEGVQVGSPLW